MGKNHEGFISKELTAKDTQSSLLVPTSSSSESVKWASTCTKEVVRAAWPGKGTEFKVQWGAGPAAGSPALRTQLPLASKLL